MKVTLVTCDNCGAEIPNAGPPLRLGARRLDLCRACLDGRAVDLVRLPVDQWPRLLRRHDVVRLLQHRDREPQHRDREPAPSGRARRAETGEDVDLALDLVNLSPGSSGYSRQLDALRARAERVLDARCER